MTDTEVILKDIAAQLRRIAGAYEIMVDHVVNGAGKKSAAPAPQPAAAPAPTASTPRKKTNPSDWLTVTSPILNFNLLDKTTKKGNPMWKLELANGFRANVFSASIAETCSIAADAGAPLIVSYTVDGKYNNIENVEIGGHGGEKQTTTARPKAQEPSGEYGPDPF